MKYHFNSEPIKNNLQKLNNPDERIRNIDIINLVSKYLFLYLNPDYIDKKIGLSDIQKVKEKIKYNSNNSFIRKNFYQLSMLSDIGKTSIIIKDIINRKIKKESNHFIGVDLGTGTGILLLSSYINAKRNNFSDIENIGFDINKNLICRNEKFFNELKFGRFILQDTTKKNISEYFKKNKKINFIINENLPSMNNSLDTGREPFLENLINIRNNLSIDLNTGFFPHGFIVELCNGKIMEKYKDLNKIKCSNYKTMEIVSNNKRNNINYFLDYLNKNFLKGWLFPRIKTEYIKIPQILLHNKEKLNLNSAFENNKIQEIINDWKLNNDLYSHSRRWL